MQLFASMAGVKITALMCPAIVWSGGSLSALDELEMEYDKGISHCDHKEVINYLSENDVNGKRYLTKSSCSC